MTPERMPPESPEGNPGSGLIDLTVAVTDPILCFDPIAAAAGGSGSGAPPGMPGRFQCLTNRCLWIFLKAETGRLNWRWRTMQTMRRA